MDYEMYLQKIQKAAHYFDDKALTVLLKKINNAEIVLLGEATHGTQEFYEIRSEISKKLILEKKFNAIAIEGDWPDAYTINNYINHRDFNTAEEALRSFDRFPTWMWQNIPIRDLVEWLKTHNQATKTQVNFFGLDLYSLYRSIDAIIAYLEKIDPLLAQEAKYYYACFEQFRHDPQEYGYSIFSRLSKSCHNDALQELKNLEKLEWQLLQEKKATHDETFYLVQNARVVKNSEGYYRSLFLDEVNNWNLRDSHMMETLEEIINYYHTRGIKNPKIIIWAHNSHIGNAAATQMSLQGEFNIGQLVKEKYGQQSFSLGFTTFNGMVSAASDWHMPIERKIIKDALPNSYENLFHQVGISPFLLTFEDKTIVPEQLLERAIGVVYAPHTERQSHYFYASLAHQFDAVLHYDTTTALEPLEKTTRWIEGEVPETYPTGL